MSEAIIVALIGGPIALISYWLQAHFARKAEGAKFERDNKREVYNQFLSALAGSSLSRRGSPERQKFDRDLLDARTRIILYGSHNLVKCLAEFWRNPVLDNDQSVQRLTALVSAMRNDIGASIADDFDDHVKLVLFGEDESVQ